MTTPLLDRNDATSDQATTVMMGLLAHGIPLTLLLDLAQPGGPDSRYILRSEPGPSC